MDKALLTSVGFAINTIANDGIAITAIANDGFAIHPIANDGFTIKPMANHSKQSHIQPQLPDTGVCRGMPWDAVGCQLKRNPNVT